jgi:nitrogen regulatory protein PII
VIGIVRPEKAIDVLEALYRAQVRGVSMSRVRGHGGKLEWVETYRATTVQMGLGEKVRLEIPVSDEFVQTTTEALSEGAILITPEGAIELELPAAEPRCVAAPDRRPGSMDVGTTAEGSPISSA